MRVVANHETLQGDSDAVTFSFADPAARLYGLARLGLSGEGEQRRGSALAVMFSEQVPVAAIAQGDLPAEADAGCQRLSLPGLAASIEEPLERWSVRLAGEDHGFDLTFEAVSPPAGRSAPRQTRGYEQLCRVRGEARLGDEVRPVDGRGQRGHSWGSPDWTRVTALHSLCAWMEDDRSVAMTVVREESSAGHDEDSRWGAMLDSTGAVEVADPRLSTTYDGQGRQRRAGLELWLDEEAEAPRRAAGTLLCGSSFELGQLRLDCSFMRWTMDGLEGVGRYDVLRRVA